MYGLGEDEPLYVVETRHVEFEWGGSLASSDA